MIPLKDDNPRTTFPFFTVLLIVVNITIFAYQFMLTDKELFVFIRQFGAIPNNLLHGESLYTPFTAMFLHGGLFHLLGNMLYLSISC